MDGGEWDLNCYGQVMCGGWKCVFYAYDHRRLHCVREAGFSRVRLRIKLSSPTWVRCSTKQVRPYVSGMESF